MKNILSHIEFKQKFEKEIETISKKSWGCSLSLSNFCVNENELHMWHDMIFQQLKFRFTDNSKPLYYKEAVKINDNNWTVVDKKFEDKHKALAYKFPYYDKVNPTRIVADTCGLFYTRDYTVIKESKEKLPDYEAIEELIYKALIEFNIIKK